VSRGLRVILSPNDSALLFCWVIITQNLSCFYPPPPPPGPGPRPAYRASDPPALFYSRSVLIEVTFNGAVGIKTQLCGVLLPLAWLTVSWAASGGSDLPPQRQSFFLQETRSCKGADKDGCKSASQR